MPDVFDQISTDKAPASTGDMFDQISPEPHHAAAAMPQNVGGGQPWEVMANRTIENQNITNPASKAGILSDMRARQAGKVEQTPTEMAQQVAGAGVENNTAMQNFGNPILQGLTSMGETFVHPSSAANRVGEMSDVAAATQSTPGSKATSAGSAVNMGLQLAPMLAPGVGQVYGAVQGISNVANQAEVQKEQGHEVSGWRQTGDMVAQGVIQALAAKVAPGAGKIARPVLAKMLGAEAAPLVSRYLGSTSAATIMQVGNNLADRVSGVDPTRHPFEGLGTAVAGGLLAHTATEFTSPHVPTANPEPANQNAPAEVKNDVAAEIHNPMDRQVSAPAEAEVADVPDKLPPLPKIGEEPPVEAGSNEPLPKLPPVTPEETSPAVQNALAAVPAEPEAAPAPAARKSVLTDPDRVWSSDDMMNYIKSKNTGDLDTEATRQLLGEKNYKLQDVPVSDVGEVRGANGVDQERVSNFSKQSADTSPPIVMGEDGRPVDGKHRLLAAQARGDKTVKAFMPVKEAAPAEVAGQIAPQSRPNKTITPSLYKRAGTVAIPTAEDITGPGSIYGEEVKPKLQSMAGGLNKIWNGFKSMFPVETGGGHEETQGIARQRFSEETNNQHRAEAMLGDARDGFDKMAPDDRLEFQRRMYNQEDQPTPELQGIAKKMYADTNEGRKALESVGHDAAKDWDDQKWNMLWKKDPQKAESLMQMLNRPGKIEGKKTFLKKQTLSDFDEGLSKGLVPKYDNPIDMFLATKAERGKYLAGVRTMQDMHKTGIVQKIAADADIPEGYGEVPSAAKGPLHKITGSKPSDAVKYIAPDGANRILDNITKPSAFATGAPGAIYKGLMTVNNTLTQAMLGLSGFHIRKVTQEMINLNAARMLENASLKPAGDASPFRAIARGSDIQKTMLGLKAAGSPEQAKAIDYMIKSGFTAKGDSTYETAWQRSFKKALTDGGVQGLIRAGMKALPAANEKLMQDGVFKYVQHAKLSIGADMMSDAIKKLGPGASDGEILKQGRKISDHLDNVLGMMNRDNLFWNRTARDLATLSTLSVGWNYGSLRALGGGVKDAVTNMGGLLKGGKVSDMDMKRVSYLASTATLTALTGAVTTYMATGHGPTKLMDYLHPPTGNKDREGNDVRLDTGFYTDDWFNFMHHPLDTAEAKGSPLLHAAGALLSNKDAGVRVRQNDDPWYKQAAQVAKYLGKTAEPLSVKQLVDTIEGGGSEGKSFSEKLAPFIGVKHAPRALSQSPAERTAYDLLSQHDEAGGRTQAQADRSKVLSRFTADVRNHDPEASSNFRQAVQKGQLQASDAKLIGHRAGQPTGLTGLMKDDRLQPEDLMKVWDQASPDERKQISWVVRGRIGRNQGWSPEQKRAALNKVSKDMQGVQ